MTDGVGYTGGKYQRTAPGSSGGGLPTLGAAYTVLQVNAAGTAATWATVTNSNVSASAAIAVTKLALGGANTVLWSDGAANSFTANPIVTSLTASSYVAVGTGSTVGAFRLVDGQSIYWGDGAGNNARGITVNARSLMIGLSHATLGTSTNTYEVNAGGTHTFNVGAVALASLGLAAGDYLAFGANPADSGAIRLSHAMGVYGESNTPGTDRAVLTWGVTANDTTNLGDANVATRVTGSAVKVFVGATEKASLGAASDDHVTLGDNAVKVYESGGEAWCLANGIDHQLTP